MSILRNASYLACVSAILLAGCAGPKLITSTTDGTPVAVDGDVRDWSDQLQPVADNSATLGVRHDADFLYIAFSTADASVMRQLLNGGLTIWMNDSGDKSEQFGVEYPLGQSGRPTADNPPNGLSDGIRPAFLAEFAIIGANGSKTVYPVDAVPGIKLEAYAEFGSFTYELRIERNSSLMALDPIAFSSDGFMGLGIKTGEAPPPGEGRTAGQGSGGRGSGGRGGGRGGGGRGGGRGPGGGPGAVEPINIWFKVAIGARS